MWTSFSCLPCSCWVLSGGAWCWQERVHLLQCQFQPLVCVYRLTCSLLVASYLLQFSPEICTPYAVYTFRQCHCKAMPFSAERCPNQAGGVAALFHLPHYLFHHFIDSALNSSCITNSLCYVVQYCTINRIVEQISHMSCWRVVINCARYSHDFITLVM